MIADRFASPQDAQRAFYQAFERADLGAMMAVWAEDEEVVCVHPGGPRRCGVIEVRESWRQIFSQDVRLRFRLAGEKRFPGRMLSVHSVYEQVSIAGDTRPPAIVLATNIYILTGRGWRMLMHHGTSAAAEAAVPATGTAGDEPPPTVLH